MTDQIELEFITEVETPDVSVSEEVVAPEVPTQEKVKKVKKSKKRKTGPAAEEVESGVADVEEPAKKKKKRKTLKEMYPGVTSKRSGYQFFFIEKSKENKEKGEKNNTVEIANQWKALEDKSKYEQLASEDKVRFEEELKALGHSFEPKPKKRAASSYLWYLRKHKGEYENCTYKEAQSQMTEKWNKLTAEEKAPYKKLHDEEKAALVAALAK